MYISNPAFRHSAWVEMLKSLLIAELKTVEIHQRVSSYAFLCCDTLKQLAQVRPGESMQHLASGGYDKLDKMDTKHKN